MPIFAPGNVRPWRRDYSGRRVFACRWESALPAGRHLHCVRWGDLVGCRESNPGAALRRQPCPSWLPVTIR